MKIQSSDLHRMCYNSIQFSSKDSSIGGVTQWVVANGFIECWASDDYVALRDQTDWGDTTSYSEQFSFALELKELKELEKWLRDKQDEIFELMLTTDPLEQRCVQVAYSDQRAEELGIDMPEAVLWLPLVDGKSLDAVAEVIEQSVVVPSDNPFAIRPERFAKFRLLKTPGETDYPIDLIQGYTHLDTPCVLWKLGPTLRGVIGEVDRTYLEEYFSDEPEVLW